MGTPSEFLKQHIGTVEQWISESVDNPILKHILSQDCTVIDGVLVTDSLTGLTFTPSGVSGELYTAGRFNEVNASRIGSIFTMYLEYLSELNPIMVIHAAELQTRRSELKYAMVKEQVYPGGTIWWRNANGIWHLEIKALTKTHMKYRVLNSPNGEEFGSALLRNMRLFVTQEEAQDLRNEGHYVRN